MILLALLLLIAQNHGGCPIAVGTPAIKQNSTVNTVMSFDTNTTQNDLEKGLVSEKPKRANHTTHGFTKGPRGTRDKITSGTYNTWVNMISRCKYENLPAYKDYGGRGITVCERWMDFQNFLDDMGTRPAGTSIDRINNDGNYEPGNCRWATGVEQCKNRRSNRMLTLNGKTMCLTDWCSEFGITRAAVTFRLKRGWTLEKSLSAPIMYKGHDKRWAAKKQKETQHGV